MSNDLVSYSRAGDVFHYRWAARRCLRMIYPNSDLTSIIIEGSKEKKKAGEYVIDVAEYYETSDKDRKIHYYQLKHTTLHQDDPFTLSDLKETFEGFAKRFKQHLKKSGGFDASEILFIILTNRKIADSFKKNINALSSNGKVGSGFVKTITDYTELTADQLKIFASLIRLEDGEGNYNVQKEELRTEIAQLIVGTVDNTQIDTLEALVKDKVLPDVDGLILKEEVLRRFNGITSLDDLYPAPAKWDENANIIERDIYEDLKKQIVNSSVPVIVHASGGVGKSVFCRNFINSLPAESFGIAFDCFGAGNYRMRSETRHLHKKALIQIANELAARGLCDPLIPVIGSTDEGIMKAFISRIKSATTSLKKLNESAQLFILIDAADNAEMAAVEFNQPCFAKELLRETIPVDCKLIMLCRTERIELLQPEDSILRIELEAFSENESTHNLLKYFANATSLEGKEFHRLTSGNPRVQGNSFEMKATSVDELLASFGPFGKTVEDQINSQLASAIGKIKRQLTPQYQDQISAICLGLAILPPNIPLEILSKTSNVSVDHIRSFIAEMGRPLWLTDSSVQFRDEPTETWFRETFTGSKKDFEEYIAILEPLSTESVYVAQVLPQLYLQAEQYQKLIEIALSDLYLPEESPADARNIRIYRLQFAFKASLKTGNYEDAIKLAMRAGEEVAGNSRQNYLFQQNIDLLIRLQDPLQIQELAFKKTLRSEWAGSENVYSASLLSGIDDFKGEATSFLKASENWMRLFFIERDRTEESKEKFRRDNIDLETEDILELAYAHLNVNGAKACITFLQSFKPKIWIFSVVKRLARRLVDFGKYETLKELLSYCIKDTYFVVAISSELMEIGVIPEVELIKKCLDLLCTSKHKIEKPNDYYSEEVILSIISFLEACLHGKLASNKILSILEYYVAERASRAVYDTYSNRDQNTFLRSLAIRSKLIGAFNLDQLIPQHLLSEQKGNDRDREIQKFSSVINGLLPWFQIRLKAILGESNLFKETELNDLKSKNARQSLNVSNDTLPRRICNVCVSILKFSSAGSREEINNFYTRYLINNSSFYLSERLDLLRSAFRLKHLDSLKNGLETTTHEIIKSMQYDNGPEEISNRYIDISRAVMITSLDDAKAYFEEAIVISSKFGDEINERWSAIVKQADHIKNHQSDQLAYRFIKCAEVVGDTVDREKYWDRSKAIMVCAKLSPGVGISALSRWRDRDIGSFEWLLYAILRELVETKVISSSIGWALASFHSIDQRVNEEYLNFFIDNCTSQSEKQFIVDDFVHLLSTQGVGVGIWTRIADTLKTHNLRNVYLQNIEPKLQVLDSNVLSPIRSEKVNNKSSKKFDSIFDNIDLTIQAGFEKSIERFESLTKDGMFYWDRDWFWRQYFKRIESLNVLSLINNVLLSDKINHYDIKALIKAIPEEWTKKISFKKEWPNVIEIIGQKFAFDFIIPHYFNYFIDGINLTNTEINLLKKGVFKGVSETIEFANSSHFFGFVDLATTFIQQENLPELLSYSLDRFELHIDQNFGDGPWDNWLTPRKDIIDNIGGFIWSALGSPRSYIRWNAVHCVFKLAQLNCDKVFASLIGWLNHDKVDAFGSNKFPFYNLHARQYLLIACSRVSKEVPIILKPFADVFFKHSILQPHVLIQKYAVDIIYNLEKVFPGIYESSKLEQTKSIGKSQFPIQKVEYDYSTESFFHKTKEVEEGLDFHFGWDFDRYWFEPLGDVFGISGKQIEDIAANIIIKEWGIEKNGYNQDPRVGIWNGSSSDRETSHDHGSYPKADNLDFYLSYHSMLVAAAKLVDRMPIVKNRDWHENEWEEWLSRHTLTRSDGKWLSDFKDAVPINRPAWVFQNETEKDWETNISNEEFLNCIKRIESDELWININGGWSEIENSKSETYHINTALVAKETSQSLMNALQTCSDPYDFKLPNYFEGISEDEEECNIHPFILKGWLYDKSVSKGLDEYDPYAEGIDYPPSLIGEEIVESLNLIPEKDNRHWYLQSQREKPVFVCESWSSSKPSYKEDPEQSGKCIRATLSFLKQLCVEQKCHIIFDVQIKRNVTYRSRDIGEYRKPTHKIFILTENGELRTTETSYKLG